jgi:two-component system sensor histidine kinase AtoS
MRQQENKQKDVRKGRYWLAGSSQSHAPARPEMAGSTPPTGGAMSSMVKAEELASRRERWDQDEEFIESIVQNITGGLLTVDLEKNVTFFNRAAEQMLGRGAVEVVGKPMETVFCSEKGRRSWVSESLRTGKVFHQEETFMLTKSGRRLRIGISTAPLKDRSNRIVGVLASFVDLSQVSKLREQKARRELLMSLGEMSAVVAHKVRNPLASIKLGMQLLRKDLTDSPGLMAQTIELIDQEVDKIERIIEELLNVVHPRDLNMIETDLKQVIARSLFAVSEELTTKKIKVTEEYSPDFPMVQADAAQLEQVFYSIFTNAIDAMVVGGQLSVRGNSSPRRGVRVEIEDNGEGISPENMPKIFDPFFTTKANGTGVGLCLARQIVEAHNASIAASSQIGKRTVFTIGFDQAACSAKGQRKKFSERV